MNLCPRVSAIVLTCNEAPNIRYCLESVRDLCEIYVVDSGSSDGTVEICREYTNHLYAHAYANHSSQWQWALDNLPVTTDWVLALDADFTVTSELKARIVADIAKLDDSVAGVYVRHRYVFGGGPIRFGGTKQSWLRLIRRGRARPDLSDLVDFRFAVAGEVARWPEAVIEYNRHDNDISVWLRKQDKFSLRLAVEEELRRAGGHRWQVRPRFFGSSDERFAWLRDRWLSMPLFLRPVLYFLYRYFLAGGFLDGRAGFLYHAMQGLWLRLLVDWKIDQLRKLQVAPVDLEALARLMLDSQSGSVDELIARWRRYTAIRPPT